MNDLITEARELAAENISQPTVFYKDKSQRIMLRLCDALEKAEAETRALSDCNRKMKEQNRRLIWRNWIPVTERLPEKYQSVLAAQQGYAPNKQHYVCEAWLNDFNWQNSYGTMENVTHWMPLPAPPAEMEGTE